MAGCLTKIWYGLPEECRAKSEELGTSKATGDYGEGSISSPQVSLSANQCQLEFSTIP